MTPETSLPFARRLWIYQAERFPLSKTVPLLAAFSAASVSASAQFAHRDLPNARVYLVAFVLAFVFSFQMRAIDEFEDAETDRLHRPERPIPRGLISPQALFGLALATTILAVFVGASLSPRLLSVTGMTWTWLGLTTFEFFAPKLLRKSAALYLLSHMAILPLIDLALTGCEWVPHGDEMPSGLWTFLAMSLCNGCVIEFGRKIRAPESERPGVETYSSAWGLTRSLLALCAALSGAVLGLAACGHFNGRPLTTLVVGLAGLAPIQIAILRFRRSPTFETQKSIETSTGVWVLVCYLATGFSAALPSIDVFAIPIPTSDALPI